MKRKITILTIFITLAWAASWGQTEVLVQFTKSEQVLKAKDFRFSLRTRSDKVYLFTSTENKNIKKNTVVTPVHSDTIICVFEFTNDHKTWSSVEHSFQLDTSNLKRLEIYLSFGVNDKKTEFLQDMTIDKFYKTHSVSIQNEKFQTGAQPIFMLINCSDTTFWGASPTNHFYGALKIKTEFGWYGFSGSYCMSTVPEKALTKGDTAYSWLPSYSPGDEYKIKTRGTYKYVISMGLEAFSSGIPAIFIANAQTRKRTRVFCEVETEFVVE